MGNTIRTTIDGAGRLVIPKRIRDQLGLTAGSAVTVSEHDGVVEVRPAYVEGDLVRKGSVMVFEPRTPLPEIDDDDVRATLERVRRDRA